VSAAFVTAATVFASTFFTVFALGVQSLNVNQRMFLASAVTSLAISSGHLWLYKVMPNPSWWDIGGYYAGGVIGITCSIAAHPYIKVLLQRMRARRVDEHVEQVCPACLHCGVSTGRPCPRLVCERFQKTP
jgi:hypothetical protein